ncbi:unnamed protein product [Rotaria magnacalcarata]|uniref:Uncharacterized protein n=2 Tax=Rotaria magnacalcarata TaxID=392030 RepID=A0A816VIT1_9BILA|nr:unnamed protein product [Rotaria magnacalcarata]CAF2080523.1 unnamed protein product [Rotaria magnacalcarata]CAF2121415.1 unnamed protein product [Rotaria magnacalcarata]CAF3757713.1 unnamed protein product [Rotaria magnacalcarata]CAF3877314.1 unnamed protein product [Rotaria magnacalcarata]
MYNTQKDYSVFVVLSTMSLLKEKIVTQYKQEYIELIVKQKTAAFFRYKQKSYVYVSFDYNKEELVSRADQPICKPKIFSIKEAVSMADEDFLIAELNSQFR